jgi:hypothetical protein
MNYYFDTTKNTPIIVDGGLAKDGVFNEFFYLSEYARAELINEMMLIEITATSYDFLSRKIQELMFPMNPLTPSQPVLKGINSELEKYGL